MCLICKAYVYRIYQNTPSQSDKDAPNVAPEGWIEQKVMRSLSGWIEVQKECLVRTISCSRTSPQAQVGTARLFPLGSDSALRVDPQGRVYSELSGGLTIVFCARLAGPYIEQNPRQTIRPFSLLSYHPQRRSLHHPRPPHNVRCRLRHHLHSYQRSIYPNAVRCSHRHHLHLYIP